MYNSYYKSGDHNAICDRCGMEYKATELKKTWDGLWVCSKDFEVRHPQDFVRGVPDQQAPSFTRPEAPDGVQEITWAASLTLEATTGSIASTDINGNVTYTKSFIVGKITNNTTINAPTNPQTNETITILFKQDDVGYWNVTWNAVFTGVTLPSNGRNNETATIQFKYNGTNWIQLSSPQWI